MTGRLQPFRELANKGQHYPYRYPVGRYMAIAFGPYHRESEHRYLMSVKLRRALRPGESVHHKDRNPHNNDPDNLELWVGGIKSGARAVELRCPHCGMPYEETA